MRPSLLMMLFGCSSLSAEKCGDVTPLCESAFTVTIQPGTKSFAPGIFTLEVRADEARIDYECVIRERGTGTVFECNSNSGDNQNRITPTIEDFAVTSIRLKAPAARTVTVSLRAHCPTRELAAHTFEPRYTVSSDDECATCRTASATLVAESSPGAFIVCPDSGVSGD
jgi:hypothetical protein